MNTTPFDPLDFPDPPEGRPLTMIDMVATIDGKTVSGDVGDDVLDLGSKADHLLLRRLAGAVDAILVGAGSLRVFSREWDPPTPLRLVLSRSGDFPTDSKYVAGKRFAVATTLNASQPAGFETIVAGDEEFDAKRFVAALREGWGVRRLLVAGGATTNAVFLTADVVDELFLTVAPLVKLGERLPTYAGGRPLDRNSLQRYRLLASEPVGDEVFLRYRRVRA